MEGAGLRIEGLRCSPRRKTSVVSGLKNHHPNTLGLNTLNPTPAGFGF